jgi:hypothetical protein
MSYRSAFAAIVLIAAYCVMPSPALADGGRPDTALVRETGAAARAAAAQIPALDARLEVLTGVAGALIHAGGLEDTRAVLIEARALAAGDQGWAQQISTLALDTGDDAAFALIPQEPRARWLEALVRYAEGKALAGDPAAAHVLLQTFDNELAAHVQAEKYNAVGEQYLRDIALSRIGSALAAGGYPGDALSLPGRMRFSRQILGLLENVALALHRAGDRQGVSETLAKIMAVMKDPAKLEPAEMLAEDAAYTFAQCGNIEGAREVIGLMDGDFEQKRVFAGIAQMLAKAGDTGRAREMAGAGPGFIDAPGAAKVLAAIAKALADKGDLPAARQTLAGARDAALHERSLNRADLHGSLINILEGQLAIGAYTDAIQASADLAPFKRRLWLLTRVMRDAAIFDNRDAVREAVSAAIREPADGSPGIAAITELTGAAQDLGEAGYKEEAGLLLAAAGTFAGKLAGAEQAAGLEATKQAQAAVAAPAGRNYIYRQLERAFMEAERGDLRHAFETAKGIGDPAFRAAELRRLMSLAVSKPQPRLTEFRIP